AHRPREHLDDAAQVDSKRVRVAPWGVRRELLQNGLQLGIRFLGGYARPDFEGYAVIDVGLRPDLERQVEVRFTPAKPWGHHADDLIVFANELERAPDHGRVAQVIPLPELVTKHHDACRVLTGRRVSGDEPSSDEGRNSP